MGPEGKREKKNQPKLSHLSRVVTKETVIKREKVTPKTEKYPNNRWIKGLEDSKALKQISTCSRPFFLTVSCDHGCEGSFIFGGDASHRSAFHSWLIAWSAKKSREVRRRDVKSKGKKWSAKESSERKVRTTEKERQLDSEKNVLNVLKHKPN